MARARKKLLYPLLTQRWFNNCLLIKKNINSKYLMQWERNPKRWQKCACHVRYPICIYQEDTSIVYINLRKLSLFPPTRYSNVVILQWWIQESPHKPFLSCLFKTRFRISFLASGVTHKEAQLMDHRPSGNDRQY